jgi:antitoxin (DNA-binding transcriptional repressor) of toxin-antitoxin stability system
MAPDFERLARMPCPMASLASFRQVRRHRLGHRNNGLPAQNSENGPLSLAEHWQFRSSSVFDKVAPGSYIIWMRSVGIKVLKNKLSEYVRLAAGGETILVTDRDRVIAEIGPPDPARSPILSDALLLDVFRQGWMTPPISVGRGPPARKPVMTIDELLNHLQRDRADR